MAKERLQKLLARAGVGSRRRVEGLIALGLVTVNGRLAKLGDKADPDRDSVKVEGRRVDLAAPEARYLLLNKPAAVMSTTHDPEGRPTVRDLIPIALQKGLVPVGRLDFMTSGLLLLTNDGDLAQRVAHPRYGCTKTYEVKVSDRPLESRLAKLRAGIVLEGRRTAPCTIEARVMPRGKVSAENSWWTVVLGEGRSRQIREMFLRIGHPVQKLRRVAIGPVTDASLAPGAFRELTPREVDLLRDPRKRKALEKAQVKAMKAKAEAEELAKAKRGHGKRGHGKKAQGKRGSQGPRKGATQRPEAPSGDAYSVGKDATTKPKTQRARPTTAMDPRKAASKKIDSKGPAAKRIGSKKTGPGVPKKGAGTAYRRPSADGEEARTPRRLRGRSGSTAPKGGRKPTGPGAGTRSGGARRGGGPSRPGGGSRSGGSRSGASGRPAGRKKR